MLKISEGRSGAHSIILRLEGRVVGPWVGELRQICEPLVGNGRQLALDLADVAFADEPGFALLANLRARGVALLNALPFVEEQLKSVAQPLPRSR